MGTPSKVLCHFIYSFYSDSFVSVAETLTASGRNTVIVGEESRHFGLRTADFETITALGVLSLTVWTQNKSHANPAWFKAAPG